MRSKRRRRRRRWTMNGDENIPKQNRIYSFATRPRILFRTFFFHRRVSLFPSFFSFFFSFFLRFVVFLEANKNGINSFCWTKCNRRATEVTQSKQLHEDFIPFFLCRSGVCQSTWLNLRVPPSNRMEQRKRNVLCDTSNGRKSLTFNYKFSLALLFRFARGKNVAGAFTRKPFSFFIRKLSLVHCGEWSTAVAVDRHVSRIQLNVLHQTYTRSVSLFTFLFTNQSIVSKWIACVDVASFCQLPHYTHISPFCARGCLTFSTISHSFSRLSCLIWIVFIGFGGAGVKAKILYSISTA